MRVSTRKGIEKKPEDKVVHVADLLHSNANPLPQLKRCDIVCVGDSITGWNNIGTSDRWPLPTYPTYLQKRLMDDGRNEVVGNGGMAGETSNVGPKLVKKYLEMFPKAKYFIMGFGTNDLGQTQNHKEASRGVIDNMTQMVNAVKRAGKTPILLNVPKVKESRFPPDILASARRKREYHNPRLQEHFAPLGVPIVDIHSALNGEHFYDELHPNQLGAELIADKVYEKLMELMPNRRSIWRRGS